MSLETHSIFSAVTVSGFNYIWANDPCMLIPHKNHTKKDGIALELSLIL